MFGFAAALMVLVSLVLAAACANVAGIMLTRATARAREIALRAALGAGRGRLARQLLTETIVLFLFSGLLGIGLARVLTHMAMLMLPPLPTSIVVPLTMDWRVLLFALSLSIGAAVGFGVLPAFRGSSVDAGASLKDGVRSSSGRSRLRSAFVVGQIACSVLLVVLGASFVRVLRHAGAADPGFDPRGVDIATLDSSVTGEPKAAPAAFWRTVIDRVRQTPAVESASLARVPPGGFEGIGLGGVAPGDQPGTTEMFVSGLEHRRHRLLRDAPHSHRRRAGFCADATRLGLRRWSSSARRSRDGSGPDSRRSENLCGSRSSTPETGVRAARRDGRWRRRQHQIEQLDRRPCRTLRLPAVGAK